MNIFAKAAQQAQGKTLEAVESESKAIQEAEISGVPNSVLRSVLFTATKRGKRVYSFIF